MIATTQRTAVTGLDLAGENTALRRISEILCTEQPGSGS
jgi:hypothetical protein